MGLRSFMVELREPKDLADFFRFARFIADVRLQSEGPGVQYLAMSDEEMTLRLHLHLRPLVTLFKEHRLDYGPKWLGSDTVTSDLHLNPAGFQYYGGKLWLLVNTHTPGELTAHAVMEIVLPHLVYMQNMPKHYDSVATCAPAPLADVKSLTPADIETAHINLCKHLLATKTLKTWPDAKSGHILAARAHILATDAYLQLYTDWMHTKRWYTQGGGAPPCKPPAVVAQRPAVVAPAVVAASLSARACASSADSKASAAASAGQASKAQGGAGAWEVHVEYEAPLLRPPAVTLPLPPIPLAIAKASGVKRS
jgi:hypothetical protein